MALTRTKENKYNKKYDERECWELAMSWGAAFTVARLHRWHKENKGFGSRMGGIWAMWRWAARNPETCYLQFKQWYFETASAEGVNPIVTFEDFLKEIQEHARGKGQKNITSSVMSAKNYKLFCEKYGLVE